VPEKLPQRRPDAIDLIAQLAVVLAALFAIWFFLWCKRFFPAVLLHSANTSLFILCVLLQALLTCLALLSLTLAAFWVLSKLHTRP
jgi:hypothetical protein